MPPTEEIRCQWWMCTEMQKEGGEKFKSCANCGVSYCSRDCQVKDWRKYHKFTCEELGKRRQGTFEVQDHETISACIRKVRMYVCPFAVCKHNQRGKGFMIAQSSSSMADLSYEGHVTEGGRRLDRSLRATFLTLNDFDNHLVKDHPGLAAVRGALSSLVDSYQPKSEVALMFIGGAGAGSSASVNLLSVQLVPDYGICRELAKDYVERDMLKMNIDTPDEDLDV